MIIKGGIFPDSGVPDFEMLGIHPDTGKGIVRCECGEILVGLSEFYKHECKTNLSDHSS